MVGLEESSVRGRYFMGLDVTHIHSARSKLRFPERAKRSMILSMWTAISRCVFKRPCRVCVCSLIQVQTAAAAVQSNKKVSYRS